MPVAPAKREHSLSCALFLFSLPGLQLALMPNLLCFKAYVNQSSMPQYFNVFTSYRYRLYNINTYPILKWMSRMLEPRLLTRLQQKKTQLDALRPLPTTAVNRLNEQLTIEWIYNSNAIEGSTLTLRETQLILETGLTTGGKSLREHLEVINHQEAIRYVETLTVRDEPITALHVRQIHRLVLARIDDDNAGQYRTMQVRIAGSTPQPPDAWEVSQLSTDWEIWRPQTEVLASIRRRRFFRPATANAPDSTTLLRQDRER
jgi:hypothetical protein